MAAGGLVRVGPGVPVPKVAPTGMTCFYFPEKVCIYDGVLV